MAETPVPVVCSNIRVQIDCFAVKSKRFLDFADWNLKIALGQTRYVHWINRKPCVPLKKSFAFALQLSAWASSESDFSSAILHLLQAGPGNEVGGKRGLGPCTGSELSDMSESVPVPTDQLKNRWNYTWCFSWKNSSEVAHKLMLAVLAPQPVTVMLKMLQTKCWEMVVSIPLQSLTATGKLCLVIIRSRVPSK